MKGFSLKGLNRPLSHLSSKNLHLTKTPSETSAKFSTSTSCSRWLKKQWPPKLSYTFGSLTWITTSSWHTRPKIPQKTLFSQSTTFYPLWKSKFFSSYASWLVSSIWDGRSSYLTVQIGWSASSIIISSQSKSHPPGPITSNSFLVSPRIWCLDRSYLLCILLLLVLFYPKPRI